MELIKAKYHAEQLADQLLLAYWASNESDKAYHLNQVQHCFELLTNIMNANNKEGI